MCTVCLRLQFQNVPGHSGIHATKAHSFPSALIQTQTHSCSPSHSSIPQRTHTALSAFVQPPHKFQYTPAHSCSPSHSFIPQRTHAVAHIHSFPSELMQSKVTRSVQITFAQRLQTHAPQSCWLKVRHAVKVRQYINSSKCQQLLPHCYSNSYPRTYSNSYPTLTATPTPLLQQLLPPNLQQLLPHSYSNSYSTLF